MSEKEKMINGQLYDPMDLNLVRLRDRASRLQHRYNQKCFHEYDWKNSIIRKLINTKGKFWIRTPFYCDYGFNITVGENVMMNFGCVLLDVCKIEIGDNTLIGPNVQIYTACHEIDPEKRLIGKEFGKPITIGSNVWIGGGSVICPGVSIGDNAVIGAGSVVTKSIPANTVSYGNPCVVKREI